MYAYYILSLLSLYKNRCNIIILDLNRIPEAQFKYNEYLCLNKWGNACSLKRFSHFSCTQKKKKKKSRTIKLKIKITICYSYELIG